MNLPRLLLFLLPGSAALAAEIAVPRYQLEVGQEIIYDGSSDFRYTDGAHRTKGRVTLWVTRQNPDGGWHLVGHSVSEFSQSREGQPEAAPAQKDEEFDAFDLGPNGAIPTKPKGYRAAALTAPFFQLPDNLETARRGWERLDPDSGDTYRSRLDEASDLEHGPWIFRQTSKGLFNEIYLMTSESRISFDPAPGLVSRIENSYSQGWGFNGKGTSTAELQSVSRKEPEWLAQFIRESDIYFTAATALGKACDDKKDPVGAIAKAEAEFRDARTQIALPLLQARFDHQLTQLAQQSKYLAESREEEAAVRDKPAADWKFDDLDGQSHSLAGYRGKVVVLDFWYRGCGWCIRAMPQIKEVVDHYKGKPVAILGANTDSDEKDARFVVEKLALNYPTLKATGLPEKYKVSGFPTLIIIDQEGIVRGRHVGYSPTLRDTVIKDIDALLAGRK